jgi:hypothetical protein
MLAFYKCFEAGKVRAPEAAVLVEPVVDGAEGFGIELIDAVAAFAMLVHEVGAAEEAEVLGDGRTGNGKGSGDFSGGLAAAAEEIEDGTAGGIGESLKGGGRRICNRTVTHNA